jgi:hypothetical protein
MSINRAVVHIGMPKAASTLFQQWLEATEELWDTAGVHVINAAKGPIGVSLENILSHHTREWRTSLLGERVLGGLLRGEAPLPSLIVSSEGLSLADESDADSLLSWLLDLYEQIVVVIAHRDTLPSAISSWQQSVRMGSANSLTEHAMAFADSCHRTDGYAAPDHVLFHWMTQGSDAIDFRSFNIQARDARPGGPLANIALSMFPEIDSGVRKALDEPTRHLQSNSSGSLVLTELLRHLNSEGPGFITFLRGADVWNLDPVTTNGHLSQQLESRMVAAESKLSKVATEFEEVSEWGIWAEVDLRVRANLAQDYREVR